MESIQTKNAIYSVLRNGFQYDVCMSQFQQHRAYSCTSLCQLPMHTQTVIIISEVTGRSNDASTLYCNQLVFLSVCPPANLWNGCTDLQEILHAYPPVAVARSSSGGVAIRYVLPVLWMTSRLAVVSRMAMRGRLNL